MGNGPSALHQAVFSGELDAVRKAIQDNPQQVDASEPANGWSALHIAAAKGYEVIARELLARGAAPNLIDKEGRTPLHLAAGQGHTGVMRDLLLRKADPLRHDAAGRTPLDAALAQQQAAAVGLLSDALAGRGLPSNPTPTGSPTKGQGIANQQRQQQQQQQQYQVPAAGGGQVAAPNIAALNLGGGYGAAAAGGGGGSDPAYPAVPAPYVADDSWLSRLPPPPGSVGGGWGGPVSVASAPSAPPASNIGYLQQQQPGQQQQQQPRQQQQQPQQQQAAVDYYDFIRPNAPQAAPAAPALAPGHAYPPVPSAAPGASIDSYADGGAQQQQEQPKQQPWWQRLAPQRPPQQQEEQQPAPVTAAPPPVAQQPAPPPQQQQQQAAEDDDGGWGGAGRNEDDDDDDGWGGGGGGGSSSSPAAGVSAAAGAGAGGRTPAASRSQPPNLNAAVGAAVSGAGKVAGAVGSIAVAGARQLLKGVMQPGAQGDDDDDYEQDESATWAGAPGRVYSYAELAAATKGFSAGNKLGAGGYGPVYRGVLDGLPVAVKLLDPAAAGGAGGQQGPKEFAAEVAILSRLHHPHIVLLIGSCPERCGLVYELMEGGSLEQHLFNPGMPQLRWQDRVRIACEVASALCFLHSAPEPIVHMDLKPGNLLLNRSLVCKVGDVGLSRLMPASRGGRTAGGSGGPVSTVMDSRLVGTPCYMDPEYLRTGRFGPKSDVYSLGVILLQMLTGLEASRVVAVVEAALARSQGDAASFASITDPRAGAWPITEAACLAHLAMRCVELQRGSRPDLRGELLPALLQLAERSRLFGGGGSGSAGDASAQRSSSLSAGSSGGPPSMMICPITQDVMLDPVFAADGYTYEREAIAGWVASHSTSPMTNLPLANTTLTPNLTLRSAIKEWEERQAGGGR